AGLPASLAEQPRPQAGIAVRHEPAFELREAVMRILLPVHVRRKVGQAAEARLAFAYGLLGVRALEVLADDGGDDVQRLLQPLVRRTQPPAAEVEHAADAVRATHREKHRGAQAGGGGDFLAESARIGDRIADPERLSGLPHGADQARAGAIAERTRAFGELARMLVVRREPDGAAAKRFVLDLPELAAIPAFRLANGLEDAPQGLFRIVRLGEAAGDAVLEPQQPHHALLRGDVAADAAVAGEALARVEDRLAADAEVAPAAVLEGAPHQDIPVGLARRENCAVRVPAALDLDAGVPAVLAELTLGELLLRGVAVARVDPCEAQLRILLPI